mgnify:CR=1 FL=1
MEAAPQLGFGQCEILGVGHLEILRAATHQQRRVALSRLMLNRARLWILDEPFVALDVAAITLLADLVAAHLAQGGLAVFTSHQEVAIGTAPPQILELGA